jgi:spermidine/putrescine-binding protein
VYNLEFALLADGVKVEDVYKVLNTPQGVDRAFAKLNQLKPYIQWWEAGAQPPQWLTAGDVVMTSTYSGRIAAAAQSGSHLGLVWPGSLYGMDYWAIIKGSKHVDQAKRFIAFANQPDAQVNYVKQIPYGPTNTEAAARWTINCAMGTDRRRTSRARCRWTSASGLIMAKSWKNASTPGPVNNRLWLDVLARPALLSARPTRLED